MQLRLAWMLNKHPYVLDISGMRREKYLIENAQAVYIKLSAEQVMHINELFNPNNVTVARYPDAGWVRIEQ